MHEASLLKNLMKKINGIAAEQKAVRVTSVSVWLGALSHISAGHFTEHFVEAVRGTIADGADLKVTVDDDIRHEYAQDILLKDLEVDVEV